jgi:hypothetical protein
VGHADETLGRNASLLPVRTEEIGHLGAERTFFPVVPAPVTLHTLRAEGQEES